MKIMFAQNYQSPYPYSKRNFPAQKYSFTSTTRLGGPGQQNTTCVRQDLDWDKLNKLIIQLGKKKKRVNIYSIACSDGTEPNAVAIKLLKKIRSKDESKFFPIFASDIDEFMIDCCKSSKMGLYPVDIERLGKKGLDKFLTFSEAPLVCPPQWGLNDVQNYKIKDKLKNCVNFETEDLLKVLKRINDEGNSVVMCRNVLPHMGCSWHFAVSSASINLKEGSLFVLGDYDHKKIPILESTLKVWDFEKIGKNIYKKVR